MTVPEILRSLAIRFVETGEHHHVTSGWLGIDCPFCSPGSYRFRMGVAEGNGACNCWVCGRHRLGNVLAEAGGVTLRAAWKLVGGMDRTGPVHEPKPAGKLNLPRHGPLLAAHRRYLKNRGFDPGELEDLWGIKGVGLVAGPWAWSILIPVTLNGRTVSWTTRSVSDAGKRYRNAEPKDEVFPIKDLLLGEDYCRHTAILVEGPFDAFRIGPGAVCSFGVVVTDAQVERLARYPRVVVAFDSDFQAQQAAEALCHTLSPLCQEVYQATLHATDPGSAGQREVKEIRERFLT